MAKVSHGSVSASKKEWIAKKAKIEKEKFDELTKNLNGNQITQAVQEMKTMKIEQTMIDKVQNKLETDARNNVQSVMGHEGYETFD